MNDPDDDLRRLLRDTVSEVEPRPGLATIRSRTDKVVPMNRRWLLPTLAAAAATIVVIVGAVSLTRGNTDDDPAVAQEPTSQETSPSSAPQGAPETQAQAVPVYFVGRTASGTRLFREFQRQQVCTDPDCLMEASVRTAVAGQPADPDYRMPWPAGTGVRAVSFAGNELTVDLTGDVRTRPGALSQEAAVLAVQQVVYSAQAGLGKGRPPVRFLLDGEATDQLLGVPTSKPVAATSADETLSAVSIATPTEGATVPLEFEVTGQAAVFEANVVWELKQGDKVVRNGFATASECCTLSPYTFSVTATPGTYTLVVHDTDESDGEGIGTSEDTKRITVQ
jgi:hypothetical protein